MCYSRPCPSNYVLNRNDKSEPVPHLEDSVRIIMRCHVLTKKMQPDIHRNSFAEKMKADRSTPEFLGHFYPLTYSVQFPSPYP